MKIFAKLSKILLASATFFGVAGVALAHEVYVLNSDTVNQAINTPAFNMFDVIKANLNQFLFWTVIGIIVIALVFWISRMKFLEVLLDPILIKLRPYATTIARFTIGVSFLAGAYYQAIYGPELALSANFGPYTSLITEVLVIIGVMAILGLYVRLAALIGIVIYAVALWLHGIYMLTYINYLGELIVLLVLGSHNLSLDLYIDTKKITTKIKPKIVYWFHHVQTYLVPKSFAILRVLFGVALIYASFYAKILHNNLALDTVTNYHLDKIFGFEPHFLVLGAALVEMAIGVFFILGVEIRFTCLFLLFWLTLSLIFFGEVVWPHLILIGIPIAFLFYGYDEYSLEGYFFRKKPYEPVL